MKWDGRTGKLLKAWQMKDQSGKDCALPHVPQRTKRIGSLVVYSNMSFISTLLYTLALFVMGTLVSDLKQPKAKTLLLLRVAFQVSISMSPILCVCYLCIHVICHPFAKYCFHICIKIWEFLYVFLSICARKYVNIYFIKFLCIKIVSPKVLYF